MADTETDADHTVEYTYTVTGNKRFTVTATNSAGIDNISVTTETYDVNILSDVERFGMNGDQSTADMRIAVGRKDGIAVAEGSKILYGFGTEGMSHGHGMIRIKNTGATNALGVRVLARFSGDDVLAKLLNPADGEYTELDDVSGVARMSVIDPGTAPEPVLAYPGKILHFRLFPWDLIKAAVIELSVPVPDGETAGSRTTTADIRVELAAPGGTVNVEPPAPAPEEPITAPEPAPVPAPTPTPTPTPTIATASLTGGDLNPEAERIYPSYNRGRAFDIAQSYFKGEVTEITNIYVDRSVGPPFGTDYTPAQFLATVHNGGVRFGVSNTYPNTRLFENRNGDRAYEVLIISYKYIVPDGS